MAFTGEIRLTEWAPADLTTLQEALGYLNFGGGKPDPRFERQINRLYELAAGPEVSGKLQAILLAGLADLQARVPAFSNIDQGEKLIRLVFADVLPSYRRHHADLLFHLSDSDLEQPFFLARVLEATLRQGGPWEESARIVAGAIQQLNDFLGHRPVAVLENGQLTQAYGHEWFRPIPLYISGAGVGYGAYQELLERVLQHLRETPAAVLNDAHFDLDLLDELALDPRAYDHQHPVYKRTNYMFGEWDPHNIDNKGKYRRFVVRAIVLDALNDWMASVSKLPLDEVLYEASAVLCGTMLMASTISGSGPNTYDSTVSLGSLLSKVARQRDAFYARLLETVTGSHGDRLRKEAHQTRQPFGKVRQHLNLFVAQHGSRQIQHAEVAFLYSRMGYTEAAREHATVIPSLSVRFETEVECRITSAHLMLDRNQVAQAAAIYPELRALIHRGIHCGALVDPWNILGFQGNFPLFHAREDSVGDTRVELLLDLMEDIFTLGSRLLSEAAADGQIEIRNEISEIFSDLAKWWDRFATSTVSGLPQVKGEESFESANQVAEALALWHAAGEAAGDIGFWRQHLHRFETAKAYALVLEALLRKRDIVAAMGLFIQWLSQADQVGLESGAYSFHQQILYWLQLVLTRGAETDPTGTPGEQAQAALTRFQENWGTILRLFDYMEANAGDYWPVPQLDSLMPRMTSTGEDAELREEDEDHDDLFDAAYEDVVFRDSTNDGVEGQIMDGQSRSSFDTDLDLLTQQIDSRLKFQVTLARLWEVTSASYASLKIQATRAAQNTTSGEQEVTAVTEPILDPQQVEVVRRWSQRTTEIQHDLIRLLRTIAQIDLPKPSGDHDSLVEYDRQLQLRFNLMNAVIYTHVAVHEASWHLTSCLPEEEPTGQLPEWEQQTLQIYRNILRGDVAAVRRDLPALLQNLSHIPLLYVPLDQGGDPEKILSTRTLQSVVRSLLDLLPRLGMFREGWLLLKTAQKMERFSPPAGTVITEFDRLYHSAFNSALEGLLLQVQHWSEVGENEDALVDLIGTLTDHYLELWLDHSQTMRLSTLETFEDDRTWKDAKRFIQKYGSEFLHAQMLTFGNLRAILHNGVGPYLDYMAENDDPLNPSPLLNDLGRVITQEQALFFLEHIFRATVEKYDRFLEYNTTTTQSDYGEQYFALLDFLRLEVRYERQAWNLSPLVAAHNVLIREGHVAAAAIWREIFEARTADVAKQMITELRKLERTYGMKLPGVTDLLNERLVKPLELDRLLAFVKPALRALRKQQLPNEAFTNLQMSVNSYLQSTTGSGLDVPSWLRSLEEEIQQQLQDLDAPTGTAEFHLRVPVVPISVDEMYRQFESWNTPLKKPGKKKKK